MISRAHPQGFTEFGSQQDLERRLARRRATEASHHKGVRGHGHGDFILRHHRLLEPLLRAALRVTGLYSRGARNALDPLVRRLTFEFAGLPEELDGFRILQLSDLHIDGMDGLAEIVAERLALLPADLCVMTGDYRFEVDGPCGGIYPRLETVLSSVRATHGVLAILGNHDEADIAVELARRGVRMLINAAVEVGNSGAGLWVVGVDDAHYYGCDDLANATENIPAGAFKILLAHTPEIFAEAAAAGIDLYLCGHTHAGQVCLPWIGPPLLNAVCPRAYTRGRWQHAGMQAYTSAGLGCSMAPVRYNCPPEIVMIELRKSR
jgi:predicted MPP superfamily phosphohydrolase